MNFTAQTIHKTKQELAQRLSRARRNYQALRTKVAGYDFERYLTQQLIKRARTAHERDNWELEEAALECIAASEQQEMQRLQAEIDRGEALLEAAKRHPNN